jgi:uncharacterized protein YbjT (DUF2867 family)
MATSVLIAGATGSIGGEVLRLSKERGYRVTALARSAARLRDDADRVIAFDATNGIPELAGHDAVVSSLGAPVAFGHKDRTSFRNVDFAANLNLLKAAKRAGIQRFVYVSMHVEPGYASTAYVLAHEEFVNALETSGLSYTIVRPTGVFSAFRDFIPMARRGLIVVPGDGSARTNPVHQTDVARQCVEAIAAGPRDIQIGGPDTLTRRGIAELAFAAVHKKPRILKIPASLMELGGSLTRMANPRLGEMIEFVSRVATIDCIAPPLGSERLSDYFQLISS